MDDQNCLHYDWEIVAVHAAYGRAVLSAHALERKLVSMLITKIVDREGQKETFDQAAERVKRLTLGPLIDRVISEFPITEELQEELDNMLFFRNELIHRIADNILSKALDTGWRQRLLKELLEIDGYFRESSARLDCFIDAWLSSKGWSPDRLMEIARAVYKGIAETHG